jgi:hypothetical protein
LDFSGHITKPGFTNASLHCRGGDINGTVNPALRQFQSTFTGINFTDCQLYQPCLIALCGDAHVVFDSPSITDIQLQGFADGE